MNPARSRLLGGRRIRQSKSLPNCAVAVCIGLVAIFGCAFADRSGEKDDHRARTAVSDGWLAMGTFFEADLRVRPEDAGQARAWLEWSRGEIARLEAVYSRHDPTSEVSSLNQALGHSDVLSRGAEVSAELEAILFSAIEVWMSSGGAFDSTIGPLAQVWSLAVERGVWPSVMDLRRAKQSVGSDRLLLTGGGQIGVISQGMRIDLDGLSKGAVLDSLRARLTEQLPDVAALLSFGQSSIVAIGSPQEASDDTGAGWVLEVHSRSAEGTELGVVRLLDRALSVSSSVGSVSEIEGETISHVVDPRTGATVEGTVDAVVVAESATMADGWSTALLVLGADDRVIRLVEQAGLDAAVFESAGRTTFTEGWEAILVERPNSPLAAVCQRAGQPCLSARAQSRRTSSLQLHSRPVPPQEP